MTESSRKLRCAVVGAGYLGKFHAQKYATISECELVAIVDTRDDAKAIADDLNVPLYNSIEDILNRVDAVSIAAPTTLHFDIARTCLAKGIHALVEKPITVTVTEADELIDVAEKSGSILQVGHMQRFHPALLDLGEKISAPNFIESHRLAPFNPRGTDVDVVLDLMIHDIDIVLNLVNKEVVNISASGASVLSESIDIANARLDFEGGCVANITASRVSQKTERKMRVFQQAQCFSADLYNHSLDIYYREPNKPAEEIASIGHTAQQYENNDALMAQIRDFVECINSARRPLVSGEDGRRALATATEITTLIQR
ncbi:MAG: Gfo/Idh/MocA family oxidoreductase [Pseudomonadota bacterium]